MLKEERELRKYCLSGTDPKHYRGGIRLITALVKAVREDDANRGFSATLRMFGDEEIGRAGKIAQIIREDCAVIAERNNELSEEQAFRTAAIIRGNRK